MDIDKNLRFNKKGLLRYFRGRAQEIIAELEIEYSKEEYKNKTTALNRSLIESRDNLLAVLENTSKAEQWDNMEILECALMIYYTNDVVMLETRNSLWEYEYMSFSRRIGELWEPFCKLCFKYPSSFLPPLFSDVKRNLTDEITLYINNLKITETEKEQLVKYYDKVWGLVTSGEIKLECDLHFADYGTKYVVDFKSGFGSNEKGNTNRLLLVGSIYHNIETENYKCLIFVRSAENNHYLETLRNSGVWEIYTGNDTYNQIKQFTGYDIRRWIGDNVDWMNDFSPSMTEVVKTQDLEKYLTW